MTTNLEGFATGGLVSTPASADGHALPTLLGGCCLPTAIASNLYPTLSNTRAKPREFLPGEDSSYIQNALKEILNLALCFEIIRGIHQSDQEADFLGILRRIVKDSFAHLEASDASRAMIRTEHMRDNPMVNTTTEGLAGQPRRMPSYPVPDGAVKGHG